MTITYIEIRSTCVILYIRIGKGAHIIQKEKSNAHTLESYIKRATSTLVILKLLSQEPMYAYQLRQVMKSKSGDQYTMPLLYHLLYKIEAQGYIKVVKETVENNRARSYYGITKSGCERMAELEKDYRRITLAVDKLLQ